jgi:hypothetical protein
MQLQAENLQPGFEACNMLETLFLLFDLLPFVRLCGNPKKHIHRNSGT